MYEFKYPFEPPWEDLRMKITTADGIDAYIFDTVCKDLSEEGKIRLDTELVRIYNDILVREEMRRRKQAAQAAQAAQAEGA